MDDNERKRLTQKFYWDARAWTNSVKAHNSNISWERGLLTAYKRIQLLREMEPDGRITIEGESAEEYYKALMELYGCIESRITELGL